MCSEAVSVEVRTGTGVAPGVGGVPAPGESVIACREVGKCYHIYDRPQDRLKQALLRWTGRRYYREFWALRGVSLEVAQGESVGIIGRNGSGKTTLLQLIAGTVAPSEGEVRVRGRVAAMLELGSGFNPEFTGRENVYLGGAVLGISRREMEARFDEIAAFADIGEFLDQPLKTYSSGMAARLAFALAFSVEPDVMIVDEILAVGDIGFQQRCLARLRRLRDNGLTLLFVSHSPDAVRSLCERVLFLDHGQARYVGDAERGIDLYLSFMREETNRQVLLTEKALTKTIPFQTSAKGKLRYGSGHVQIEGVRMLDAQGEECGAFGLGEAISIEATILAMVDLDHVSVSFLVRDMTGVDLMGTTLFDERMEWPAMRAGERRRVRFTFENRLHPGHYGISLAAHRVSRRDYSDNVLLDQVDGCAAFLVVGNPDRPVHYKFFQPVAIAWEVVEGMGDVPVNESGRPARVS
jgi:lipopolysaccharide transport system ATP-binding protein